MAEAEDVITDVARHATVFAQELWRRHRATRPQRPSPRAARRRAAPRPADRGRVRPQPIRSVARLSRRRRRRFLARTASAASAAPRVRRAIPATDGMTHLVAGRDRLEDASWRLDRFRTVALQQAMRAAGAALPALQQRHAVCSATSTCCSKPTPPTRHWPVLLPGMQRPLQALRAGRAAARPALASFPVERARPLETLVRG